MTFFIGKFCCLTERKVFLMKELLMGNEAIAVGALAAGVNIVCGYPGTPSSEVIDTIAKRKPEGVYVEWSVNEKTAMEVAAGAAYSGSRTLVTMKQMGLNVCADPLMCVNYIGVKGGLVVLTADDPGPISSQTEQDSRHFGKYAYIPVLDPSTPEQAFRMVQDAFELSEKIGTPVILRPTTRVCHNCASIDVPELKSPGKPSGFVKSSRWVIFPKLAYDAKSKLFERETRLSDMLSEYGENEVSGSGKIGVACGGVSCAYTKDAIAELGENFKLFSVATPYPFPEKLALEFLSGLEKVIVFEELDPVIEDALITVCGKYNLNVKIFGKRTGDTIHAGENSQMKIKSELVKFADLKCEDEAADFSDAPALPARPPILCAGCPHRASFYAVKQAMKGKKAVFCGDIGCYTLGNAMPLDMVDTCLCMGASVSVPQGMYHSGNDAVHFGFIGDSTFFHSGITNVINAVYNQAEEVVIILDNSTTAMTGHQPHPGIGKTMMGDVSEKVSIEKILTAIGVTSVRVVDPLCLKSAINAVKEAAEEHGVRCIIFRSPCVALFKPKKRLMVNSDKCKSCMKCVKELGCPAISTKDGKAFIDDSLCNGCGICAEVCPFGAFEEVQC